MGQVRARGTSLGQCAGEGPCGICIGDRLYIGSCNDAHIDPFGVA
jgi:hypothetical protein